MKKLLLLIIFIVPLLFITGCGKEEEKVVLKSIEYFDDGYGFKTTFKYDPSLTFTNVEYNDEGKAKELEFENKELGLDFSMYYTDSSKKLADSVKESRSEKSYYKEFKFNGYEGYCYSDYDDQLYVIINLKEDKNNVEYDLFISIESKDTDTVVYDVFTQNILQDFFKSIEFEDTKKDA